MTVATVSGGVYTAASFGLMHTIAECGSVLATIAASSGLVGAAPIDITGAYRLTMPKGEPLTAFTKIAKWPLPENHASEAHG
jgi:hypothetical protein